MLANGASRKRNAEQNYNDQYRILHPSSTHLHALPHFGSAHLQTLFASRFRVPHVLGTISNFTSAFRTCTMLYKEIYNCPSNMRYAEQSGSTCRCAEDDCGMRKFSLNLRNAVLAFRCNLFMCGMKMVLRNCSLNLRK